VIVDDDAPSHHRYHLHHHCQHQQPAAEERWHWCEVMIGVGVVAEVAVTDVE